MWSQQTCAARIWVGEGQGLDHGCVEDMHQMLPAVDMTIIITPNAKTAACRKANDLDKYERDLALLTRVSGSYRRQASQPNWVRAVGCRGGRTSSPRRMNIRPSVTMKLGSRV